MGADYELYVWGRYVGYSNASRYNITVAEGVELEYDFALEEIAFGDVNGDGRVNVADAIFLLRSIVGLVTLEPSQFSAADVNLDGEVNVADAIVILRYIVGLVPELPV